MDTARRRIAILTPVLMLLPAASSPAGDHHARKFVPIYAQPVAAPLVYAQAPTATTYVVQAQTVASAPASASTATVGSAPGMVAGSRIKAVDREDIIEELRTESKSAGTSGSRRDRRKSLREAARTKFGEAIGVEADSLNDAENQDIENIVAMIMDGGSTQAHPAAEAPKATPAVGYAPTVAPAPAVGYTPVVAPTAAYAPAPQTVQYFQPMVPVQVWVPVQPKHHLFHH